MVDEVRELNLRYGGTWLGMRTPSKVMPINIHEFRWEDGEPGDPIRIIYQPNNRSESKSNFLDDMDIIFDYPKLGYVNVEDYCIHLQRFGYRQYRKGYDSRNITRTSPVQEERMMLNRSVDNSHGAKTLDSLFNPSFLSVRDTFTEVSEGNKLACAFNSDFFFALKAHSPKVVLGYKQWIIGNVNSDNMEVEIPEPFGHMDQSVSEFLRVRRV